MRSPPLPAVLLAGALLLGCQGLRPIGEGEVLALGDSVIEWNLDEEASIPDWVALETGLTVANGAISGSMVLEGDAERIPERYESRDWRWVILEGGANDVGPDGCGCGDCSQVVDRIIAADHSSGEMVELVDRALGDGAKVVLLGYYMVPSGTEFEGCEDEIELLNARYASLADAREQVWFFDMGEVMTPETLDLFAEDRIHPSLEGSEAVGRALGQLIAGLE